MKKLILSLLAIVPFVTACSDNHVTSEDVSFGIEVLKNEAEIINQSCKKMEKGPEGSLRSFQLSAYEQISDARLEQLRKIDPIDFAVAIRRCRLMRWHSVPMTPAVESKNAFCDSIRQEIRTALSLNKLIPAIPADSARRLEIAYQDITLTQEQD